jgi:DNA (cytosine-5)-methyltransferase 1
LFNRTTEPRNVWDAISDPPAIEKGESLEDQPYQVPVLSEYQDWLRNGSDLIVGHQTRKLAPVNMDRVLALPREGMNWTCLPPKLIPDNLKRLSEKYGDGVGSKTRFSRLRKNGLFSTIVTSPDPYWGAFIHPTQNRVISVREAARAQSFPDYVKFEGNLVSKYRQIGNAVPPLLAAAIGKKIREVL